jgi:hypothetical protein
MKKKNENSDGRSISATMAASQRQVEIGWFALSAGAPISLAWLIIQSPDRFIYDEVLFIKYVALLHQHGFSREFLLSLPAAPGPLVGVVQFLFSPITYLEPVRMRFVNFALLSLVVVFLWKMQPSSTNSNYLRTALSALTIPMTWVLSGLALTEVPAMVFVTASIFFLLIAIKKTCQGGGCWWPVVLSGLFLGIATWGKQPYVLLCGVPVLLALQNPRFEKSALLYCGLVVACLAPLVFVWGGFVPPSLRGGGSRGIAIDHMLFSLGYTGIVFFLLAPEFFFRVSNRWALGGLALATLTNLWLQVLEFYPLRSVALRYLSAPFVGLYGAAWGSALFAIGLLFALLLLKALWDERREPRRLIAYSGLLICAIHPLFVTGQYSSRYAAMSLPYLILSAYEWPSQSNLRLALACAGSALGVISLLGYYET